MQCAGAAGGAGTFHRFYWEGGSGRLWHPAGKCLDGNGNLYPGLRRDEKVHTTLAVVHTLADGDRDFSFYRNPGADMQLRQEEVPFELIQQAKIFHFGTLSMTDEPVRSATYAAIAEAERCGVLRSFDPNLRPPLWRSLEEAKEQVCYGLAHCDILKISDNEIQWLTGLEGYDQGVSWIRERYPAIKLILLSMGKDGSRAYAGDIQAEAKAFRVDTIETTGAGDTFLAQCCIMF